MAALFAVGVETVANAQTAAPEIRFPEENQATERSGSHGPITRPWSDPPSPRAVLSGPGELGPDRDSVADQLNRAELNRLLGGGRGARRGQFR
jgi:hypothetical protein